MAFDFTSATAFKPKVQNTFLSKGGGGGNTGYFQQERKKKDDDKPILGGSLSEDVLEKMSDVEIEELKKEPTLLQKIKGFLKK